MTDTVNEDDERLDLVDNNDNPIGIIDRREVFSLDASGKGYTRAVGIFLVNTAGQLWIPVRSMQKSIAPGGLDFSAGEHVGAGESYKDAAMRGLQEELNIDAVPERLRFIGVVPPFPAMPYFHHIFTYQTSESPQYNTTDYTNFRWLDPASIIKELESGIPAKAILLPSVQLVVSYLEEHAS